jgi:hypothetical protein
LAIVHLPTSLQEAVLKEEAEKLKKIRPGKYIFKADSDEELNNLELFEAHKK